MSSDASDPKTVLKARQERRVMLECSAFLFDMDGVLVDSQPVIDRHWQAWACKNGLDQDAVVAFGKGRPTVDTVREFRPGSNVRTEAARLEAMEGQDTVGLTAIPNARRLLECIQPRDWAVVTSSSRQTANTRLGASGLPIPDVLVCSGEIEQEKPAPDGYVLAAAKLGVPPSECVVIEDSFWGVRAGLAADASVIWLSEHQCGRPAGNALIVTGLEAVQICARGVGAEFGPRYSVTVSAL